MDIIQVVNGEGLHDLESGDYSFEVRAVAEPPFDGPDIVNVRSVAPFQKTYSMPVDSYRSHIGSPHCALFVGSQPDHQIIGFIALSVAWNGFAQIDGVAVDSRARGKHVGSRLVKTAIEWTRKSGSAGLKAETQTLNVPACRLYRRCGFELGGFDRFHYGKQLGADETALFWYLLLPSP